MAKKSIYSEAEYSDVKEELDKALTELETLPIEEAVDDMEVKSGINGTKTPYIISSIEDKLKTAMVIIVDSVDQLKAIHSIEGYSNFLSDKLSIIEVKLEQIQNYYKKRTYSDINHRFYEADYSTFSSKGPKVIKLKLEACTKEMAVKTRSTIQKQILKLLPIIAALRSEQGEEKLTKGNKGIPLSLQGRI